MCDVIVVGGGPAGCSAAIRLAQIGMRVRLYEKASFPRPKLCGGFLSAEAIPELAHLGVLEEVKAAGAWPIHRILVSSAKGIQASSPLSNPGHSISRQCLDSLLLNQARKAGVNVTEEDGMRHINEGDWTIMATGRTKTLPGKPTFYGIQAFFDGISGMTDQIELDMIPGGYFGLARQEDGLINVCGLVNQKSLRDAGPHLDQAMRHFAAKNPLLRQRFREARRRTAWQATGPVTMGLRELVQRQTVFLTGDAACVVDPFAGEGMAMSLVTGRLLRNAFEQAPSHPGRLYEQLWHAQFDGARRLQTAICWAIEHSWWQELLAYSCQTFPMLMPWLTDNTRPYYANIESNPNLGAI